MKKAFYENIKKEQLKGWNTWNTRSVLSHVFLPDGFFIQLGLKDYKSSRFLNEALIGRMEKGDEVIFPIAHSYDGSFTKLNIKWSGMEFVVTTASNGDDIVIKVEPVKVNMKPPALIISCGYLWNKKGVVKKEEYISGDKHTVYIDSNEIFEPNVPVTTPYYAVSFDKPVIISTKENMEHLLEENEAAYNSYYEAFGEQKELYRAMENAMAWDTIYDPEKHRAISTVSRLWNVNWGGWSMYCWDTFFGALMASVSDKNLAYSNFFEMLNEKTKDGFVPNYSAATGAKSSDRSQPPVAANVALKIYRHYGEKEFLEYIADDLYTWNRWFLSNRQVKPGLFAWGSNPFDKVTDNEWEENGVDDRFGAALESGLDNSPMYDDIPFDKKTHCLKLVDVGLTGLMIEDCYSLSEIFRVLGDKARADELTADAKMIEEHIEELWCEDFGFYLNKRTDTNEFSYRISPTNFYALYSRRIPKEHLGRMIEEHFYNPIEFYGDWMIPAISRNDPGFKDNNYWRGRIWAPLNYLVYNAMVNHTECDKALGELKKKSEALLMKEWMEHGHIHENYNAETGEGCDVTIGSDRFYHWGALLAYMNIEKIYNPEMKL